MKIFSSKLSLFLIICFWSNSLIAQFNNNNNFNYFPQAFFNKNDAAAKLTKGKSTIQGVAFTRENTNASTAKHYGKNTIVMLFPVTDYLIEWQN